jgi:hypothetical protein
MQTKFVELDLPLAALPPGQILPEQIEQMIADLALGEPLRWAITHVEADSLHIEAILTSSTP